jgi:PAS domain S-box-containing protein
VKKHLAFACLPPLIALILQWWLWQWITPFVWFLFFPAVFISARLGGLRGGMLGTVLSIICVWYVFIPPQFSFAIDKTGNHFVIAMFLVMGFLISDIHERLQRVQQQSDTRFEATFELAAVGLAIVSPIGRWLRVNHKLCEMLGYSTKELLALTFQDITHPDDLSADLHQVQRMLNGEIHNYTMEKRYLIKNGATLWIKLTVSLVSKPNGAADYFIAVIEDIHALKQAAEQIAKSQQQMQAFIHNAPHCIAMFDQHMNYLAISDRWLKQYGRGHADLLGLNHYAVHPDMPASWKAVHQEGLAGKLLEKEEDCWQQEDGTRLWLSWAVSPWRNANDEIGGIIISAEDITARKLAEEELYLLNAELEQRVKQRTEELMKTNQELDSFSYAVSHDLRAPLRAMSGFSQALIEDYGAQLPNTAIDYLQQIDIAGRKMSELIDGLLSLSRNTRNNMHLQKIDLSALAEDLAAELTKAEPSREVRIEIQPGITVNADAAMLTLVLQNLLGNAWKYSCKTPAACIKIYTEWRDDRHCICIADNGAGFDMTHSQRLFQPFQRLHRQDEFPGIGIGLATVQRIIHRHGGLIEAQAAPGKGAVFCFSLGEN